MAAGPTSWLVEVAGCACVCRRSPHGGEASLDRTGCGGNPVLAGQQLLHVPGSLAEAWFACQGSDAGSQSLGAETAQPVRGRADPELLQRAPPGGLIRKERHHRRGDAVAQRGGVGASTAVMNRGLHPGKQPAVRALHWEWSSTGSDQLT